MSENIELVGRKVLSGDRQIWRKTGVLFDPEIDAQASSQLITEGTYERMKDWLKCPKDYADVDVSFMGHYHGSYNERFSTQGHNYIKQ